MSPTNWIDELRQQQEEERRRAEAAAERERAYYASQRESLQRVRQLVCPVLERIVTELRERTGIALSVTVAETAITVRAPEKTFGFLPRIDAHRFVISDPDQDSRTVGVAAIEDTRVDRLGDPPDDMSMSEWRGDERTILAVRSLVSDLAEGDLDLLVQWLTKTALDDNSPWIPKIGGQVQQEAGMGAKRKASWALACSIASLVCFPMLLPLALVGLWLGLQVRHELVRLGERPGRVKAAWAIALGFFGTMLGITVALVYLTQVVPR